MEGGVKKQRQNLVIHLSLLLPTLSHFVPQLYLEIQVEAEWALGALLSTKKNQGNRAIASLLASYSNPDQDGVCSVEGREGCSPFVSQRSLRSWGGRWGATKGKKERKGCQEVLTV